MSTPKRLPSKDVVIIGLGWTGSILANELTDEGLDVVAIERGPWRDTASDFAPNRAQDELRYRIRHELFLQPEQTTFTFRNKMDQTALPIRNWGAFMPPNGVGGGGVHWNAETWRFLPSDFVLRSHLTERYGARFLPADMTIQDWGVTFDELEPFYDRFEYLCGTSGTAGNLNGKIQSGGNPFEGPRSRPYPTPAQQQPFSHALFGKAAAELGYKPFPQPSGNLSQAYTNPLGVRLGPCTYCGFCEWFGCGNYSKASPQTTLLPVLVRKPNFLARDQCEVTRINTDASGRRASGVTYVDASGTEWEQPADLVILSAYTIFNVQLLLLSGIGTPYDPVANKGVVGRNFTHQTISDVESFFDKSKFIFNPSGHNRFAAASGPMAEEVADSSSRMTDTDLAAIAAYLKDRASRSDGAGSSTPADDSRMSAGAAIYADLCSACHKPDGTGIPYLIPNLAALTSVNAREPTTLLGVVLHGTRSAATAAEPTAPAMPEYGSQLTDPQIAAVLTYIRGSWGHTAGAVTEAEVRKARSALSPAR